MEVVGPLVVIVAKPFGERAVGEHQYWILVNGTSILYSPSGRLNAASRN